MRSIPRLLVLVFLFGLSITAIAPAERIDPGRGTAAPGDSVVWYDFSLLTVEGKGWQSGESYYDRLPAKAKATVPPSVWNLSHHSSGICARFTTDAPLGAGALDGTQQQPCPAPHGRDRGERRGPLQPRREGRWRFVQNGRPLKETNTAPFTVKPGVECILYLPLYNGVRAWRSASLPTKPFRRRNPPPAPEEAGRLLRHLHHARSVRVRPGMSFTNIVGRMLDTPVINLGFSGSGKMETAMSDLLVELDPSVYVLDCIWNMTPQMVGERVEPFVKKLREARPDTPIILAEDCNFREISPTEKGRILRDVYAKLRKDGVKKLYFLPNKGMMGNDWEGTVDGAHPNDLGMMRQAEVFAKALRKVK